ncbi:MAG: hypothetical protein AMXMBFR53_30130 [Gemmatimonadota bacterium]
MTRAEWDAMNPRERDAYVAEKVMGWEVTHRGRRVRPGVDRADPHVGGVPREVRGFTGLADAREWIGHKCGRYTTTPEGMMAVVEKMADEGWFASVVYRLHEVPDRVVWDVALREIVEPWGTATAWADTAPEAVALAALTALGHMEAP